MLIDVLSSRVFAYTMPKKLTDGSEYFLNISVCLKKATLWAKKGYEIAYKQLEIPVETKTVKAAISDLEVKVTEKNDGYHVEGKEFFFLINKKTGAMEDYTYQGEVLMEQGPVPNFYRAELDNDKEPDAKWKEANKNISLTSLKATENAEGLTVINTVLKLPNAGNMKETITYTINGTGEITVKLSFDASAIKFGDMYKVGSTLILPSGYENVSWYGDGPVEDDKVIRPTSIIIF